MIDATVQAELSRLQCLQALGITVYHPRFRLPGARASVQGPWAELPAAETTAAARGAATGSELSAAGTAPRAEMQRPAVAPTMANAEAATPQAARRVEISLPATPAPRVAASATESATESAPKSAAESATESAAEKAGAPGAVQNFQLLFLQVDADLAIVNQIPALARPQLQDKQLALLANLLRWLGKSVPAQAPRVFRWPLPGLEQMAASMSPQTSLLHFLEQAASERSFRFLLQLGPQALTPAASAWQAFATHSLDEMLALPSLKREVWQTLLPLHEALRRA